MTNLKQVRRGYRYEFNVGPVDASPKRKLVVFEVSYLAGSSRKGVLASLRHTEIEDRGNGFISESFEVFGGVSAWAKVLARKSDKEVVRVAEALDSYAPEIVAAFISGEAEGRAALQAAIALL